MAWHGVNDGEAHGSFDGHGGHGGQSKVESVWWCLPPMKVVSLQPSPGSRLHFLLCARVEQICSFLKLKVKIQQNSYSLEKRELIYCHQELTRVIILIWPSLSCIALAYKCPWRQRDDGDDDKVCVDNKGTLKAVGKLMRRFACRSPATNLCTAQVSTIST